MSFWKRLLGFVSRASSDAGHEKKSASPAPAAGSVNADAAAPQAGETHHDPEDEQLARLRLLGRRDGADPGDALLLLRSREGSPGQTDALHAILEGLADVPQDLEERDTGVELLRVACASLLHERGQTERALELIGRTRSVEGMMLAAELNANAGRLARAVSTIERVLAKQIDTPGARERHQRWSAQLGRSPQRALADDGATVVTAEAPHTSYRLLREVARGGAGTVYEAEDELLGRRLAYKVYHRGGDEHAQIENEARAAAKLRGPGVLRIFDADPEAGWLAAEWLPRGSLRDILRGGRAAELLPLASWVPGLAATLARVHASGVVHCDVKPANVFFRAEEALLGDFGISQASGATQGLGGTPGYLAPERLDGEPVDPRDDIYAFGRILEDVIGAVENDGAEDNELRRYNRVALQCLAAADARPTDGTALVQLLLS